jgi:hypothetical protein
VNFALLEWANLVLAGLALSSRRADIATVSPASAFSSTATILRGRIEGSTRAPAHGDAVYPRRTQLTLRDRAALQYTFEMTFNEGNYVVVDLVKVKGDTSLLTPAQAKMHVAAGCLSGVLFSRGDCAAQR